MTWLRNMRVGAKLALGFGLVVMLMFVVWVACIRGLSTLGATINTMKKDAVDGITAANASHDAFQDSRRWRYIVMTEKGHDKKMAALDEVKASNQKVSDLVNEYEKTVSTKEDQDNVNAVKAALDQYAKVNDEWAALIKDKKYDEALVFLGSDLRTCAREVVDPAFKKLIQFNVDGSNRLTKEANQLVSSTKALSTGLVIFASLISIIFCFILTKLVVGSINQLNTGMESLSTRCLADLANGFDRVFKGDLTAEVQSQTEPIPDASKDELGRMATIFNGMLDRVKGTIGAYNATREQLAKMVRQIQENANTVASTSNQLSSSASETTELTTQIAGSIQHISGSVEESSRSSQQIAEGSEKLASTATEAAASMEKLHSAIELVTKGSEDQAAAAQASADNVKQGINAVEKTIASMNRIEVQVKKSSESVKDLGEKGQQIGEIVQTIEDIAQQTNLLALNAAIEAARAGDQGKGFAVVADEVRKLAERSALATQEIGALIASVRDGVDLAVKAMDMSTNEVQEGAAKSQEAGEALKHIVEATAQVTKAIGSNRDAVAQMVKDAENVSMTIATAAAVSEENAAAAEELSAGTQEIYSSTESVNQATSEASASIEAVADAVKQLNAMADDLRNIVMQFKIGSAGVETYALHGKRAA